MRKTRKIASDNPITNFYEKIPKDLNKKFHNPHFKEHLIVGPFRMLIVGQSGAGKTNIALEILHRMSETFEFIVINCKSKDEPLYQYLEKKIPEGKIEFNEITNGNDVPDVQTFSDGKRQVLVIFDDLVLEKNQAKIEQYFIRGRKFNVSSMYLTQSYFRTPKTIRINCNYIIFKKLSSSKDLTTILSEYALGVDKIQLAQMYKISTQEPLDFFMIRIDAPEYEKFSKNFLQFF